MSTPAIRRFPDPLLKQPTHPVERIDEAVRRFLDAMVRVMRSQPRCVGLAAPQIGSDLRIAVMDATGHPKTTDGHGLLLLVNPRILEGEGQVVQREGCLSVPDFTGNVRRAARVRLVALDREGRSQEWRLDGFEAIIAQHEVDHLDGLLFLDRITDVKADLFKRKTYV